MANSLAWYLYNKGKTSLRSKIKPKVTFITSSMNLGGAERQLLLLCNELMHEVEIEIISLDASGPLLPKYKTAWPDLKVVDSRKLNPFFVLLGLRNLIKISRPDIVITWLYKADILGGIATKLIYTKTPVLWSARNSEIPNLSFVKKWMLTFLSKKIPTIIVANGSPAIEFHKSLGYPQRKVRKIGNLLAPWTAIARSDSRLLSGFVGMADIRLGLAARQVSGKGILETISAVENCSFAIDLQIIGQNTPESLGWRSSGKYRGYDVREITDDRKLEEWFTSLDLYLMSSNQWESQPNALLEAIAIGCPVLISDKIKLDFALPPELTYNSSEVGSLEDAISTLASLEADHLRRLVTSLQQLVLMRFSKERVVGEWLDLIRGAKSDSDK
jgi:glycosyltransferase involved in cell wall biosynthesis